VLCRRRQTILQQRGGSVEALLLTALPPHLTQLQATQREEGVSGQGFSNQF
jgi:hypothetical protein